MSTISEQQGRSNILLVAITRMGDLLQSTPTIVGLKRQYPQSRITVLVEKQFASICRGIPGIDELVELDLVLVCRCLHEEREGLVNAFDYLTDIVEKLRDRNFDFAINLSNSAYTALLISLLGIEDARGWVSDTEGHRIIRSPWAMLFSAFVYHSNRDYNSLNLVDIFRCSAGVDLHPTRLIYNVSESGKEFGVDYLKNRAPAGSGPLIAVQAGASQEKRQWAPTKFAELIRTLIRDLDAQIVLIGSSGERGIVERIANDVDSPNVSVMAGSTELEQLAGLLEQCDVLITGDTGPMHLSVAVGTPVVSLFLASALCFETGPYSEGNFVIQPLIECNPCNPNFPCARPDCHDQISPALVAYLTKVRLSRSELSLHGVQVPAELATPGEVSVYITTFDENNFLDFVQVNPRAKRHGRFGEFFHCSREAYRALWKTEFCNVEAPPVEILKSGSALEPQGRSRLQLMSKEDLSGIQSAVDLTQEGIASINELKAVIIDQTAPASRLGELSQQIEGLDKKIEEVGLSHPVLGALTRVFVMEKENMRGDDPLQLASEMSGLYKRLGYRAQRFGEFFEYYRRQLVAGTEQ